jgi:hypothetical protein
MIVLKRFQWWKSFIHDPSPVMSISVVVFRPPSPWVRKPALGDVVLNNGVHDVIFGDAVSNALKDNFDPTVEGSQVGLPQHRSHRVLAHRVAHRFTQLARTIVEPVDSKRAE